MKKAFIIVAMIATLSCAAAQETYTREGNRLTAVITSQGRDPRAYADSLTHTWTDTNGITRPIWIARTGSCFVIRRSERTGNEYRQYLPREVSAAICKELGREYKPKNAKK